MVERFKEQLTEEQLRAQMAAAREAAEEAARHARLGAIPAKPAVAVATAYKKNAVQAAQVARTILPPLDVVASKDPAFRDSETLLLMKELGTQKAPVESVQFALG